jgi:hypothetical protein
MWSPFSGDPTGILGFACFHNVWDPTNPNSVAAKFKNSQNHNNEADNIVIYGVDSEEDDYDYDDEYYDEFNEYDEDYEDDFY